jgi:putative two-component system response regulator
MKPLSENWTVGILSELLARECGYNSITARQIRMAAVLHDCGKKYIPKEILEKPGKLTLAEFEIMKSHTKLGAELLSSLCGELGKYAQDVALWHHEHIDGGGYWGLRSHAIPKYVKIVSLCDVLAALLFSRRYKPAWPPEDALAFIQKQAGTQFCPELVKDFILLIRTDNRVPAIFSEVMKKNGNV